MASFVKRREVGCLRSVTEDAGKVRCGITLTDRIETHIIFPGSSIHSMSKIPNYAVISETRYASLAEDRLTKSISASAFLFSGCETIMDESGSLK